MRCQHSDKELDSNLERCPNCGTPLGTAPRKQGRAHLDYLVLALVFGALGSCGYYAWANPGAIPGEYRDTSSSGFMALVCLSLTFVYFAGYVIRVLKDRRGP